MTWRRRTTAPSDGESIVRVFSIHTHVEPPLGADTWVHAEIMRSLDRSSHEVHVACVAGPAHEPTPTWRCPRTDR